jgi:ankyrin repeat protein
MSLVRASETGNVLDSKASNACATTSRSLQALLCRFINQGADVDYICKIMHEGKETPLTQAAGMGHADALSVLISQNTDANKLEPCHGCTALHASAQGGHVPVMQLLISKGARIDARIDVRDKLGKTPLHQAAGYGQQKAAICLLYHGADVNCPDNEGATPLMMAAQEKHLPLVDLLLIRGADPNLPINHLAGQQEVRTALHITSFKGFLEIAERLVEGGANGPGG